MYLFTYNFTFICAVFNCEKTPQNLAFFLFYMESPSLQVNIASIKSEYPFFFNPGLVRSGVMRCKKRVIQPDYPRTFCCSNVSLCQHPHSSSPPKPCAIPICCCSMWPRFCINGFVRQAAPQHTEVTCLSYSWIGPSLSITPLCLFYCFVVLY